MPPFDRLLWRLAGRLADRIARLQSPPAPISLDQAGWLSARRLAARLDEIAGRNWKFAGEHLRWELLVTLRRLHGSLGTLIHDMPPAARLPQPPSQRLIYEELLAARDEFDDFRFDLRRQTLCVTTGEITLEDVALGRFQIVMDLTVLGDGIRFQVIAKTPNPSASRSDVTHPHVLDDHLCEGDAEAPLKCALRTGRLCDFFQIIEQTLQTYNAESAYAALDGWEDASECHCCGDRVPDHSSHYCDHCHDNTCEDCSTSCLHCGDSACDSCIDRCPDCEEPSCTSCLQPCSHCQHHCCPDCLTESLCEKCHALDSSSTNEADDPPTTTITTPAASDAPVFAGSLGEAAVPAGSG